MAAEDRTCTPGIRVRVRVRSAASPLTSAPAAVLPSVPLERPLAAPGAAVRPLPNVAPNVRCTVSRSPSPASASLPLTSGCASAAWSSALHADVATASSCSAPSVTVSSSSDCRMDAEVAPELSTLKSTSAQ